MELYLAVILLLALLAVTDLVVGVSNDAVNFLTSAIGSRVAPFRVIMIVASLGILAGVTFSSGMMEVARKGIFQPQLFTMPELITVFLAVMLTDVLLLDLFNTFGLPTSTTVSIVFELLGGAVAVSLLKIAASGQGPEQLIHYINTAKALAIISGILISVAVAFVAGMACQFLARLLFTFDYQPRLRRYGGLWGGLAMATITYFILIKGAKGASFLTPETVQWIASHSGLILAASFCSFALVFQALTLTSRVNVFKPIVLAGTFALAMAFAANDLVNFIGVPLAALAAYRVAAASSDPLHVTMAALQGTIRTDTILLLASGGIMVLTLWTSAKARSVTRTSVELSRQEEGMERFGSSVLSRAIVGMCTALADLTTERLPQRVRRILARRLDPERAPAQTTATAEPPPAFDLVRASVNLIVASVLVAFATSLKLPLSTTYVTFMVAMGTSLADQAWGRESAVYRVTGVLTVIGGWFVTAVVAFTLSALFATVIATLHLAGIVGLLLLDGFMVFRSFRYHHRQQEKSARIANLNLKNGVTPEQAVDTSFSQVAFFLHEVSTSIHACLDALFSEDRPRLRELRERSQHVQQIANTIIANIFKTLYLLDKHDVETTTKYSRTIATIQEISESHRDIVMRAYSHVTNFHTGLHPDQKQELQRLRVLTSRLLENTAIMLKRNKRVDFDYIGSQQQRMADLLEQCNRNQIRRIQSGRSKIRLSILYYGLLESCQKITGHTEKLLEIFRDHFGASGGQAADR